MAFQSELMNVFYLYKIIDPLNGVMYFTYTHKVPKMHWPIHMHIGTYDTEEEAQIEKKRREVLDKLIK